MRVFFGFGVRARAIDELRELGAEHIVVITTPGRAEAAAELGAPILPIAQPQVPREVVGDALARLDGTDAILSFGGGTATGLGKAIAHHRDVLFGALPTTYAGSEMTDIWATSHDGTKTTTRDPRVMPELVLYDAELALDLPIDTTITSALNAMAHAVDASWNGADDALLADCVRAVETWVRTLPRLVRDPRDVQHRKDAFVAAHRSGIALQRGTMGLQHQLAHVLGALGLPHADTHATLLPHVLAYNHAHSQLPIDATSLYELMQNIGAPTKLAKRVEVHDVVQRVMRDPYPNPEPLDATHLAALLDRAMEGVAPLEGRR